MHSRSTSTSCALLSFLSVACGEPPVGGADAGAAIDARPPVDAQASADAPPADDGAASLDGGAGVDALRSDGGGGAMLRTIEEVYRVTDLDPARISVRSIAQLVATDDRLYWNEDGFSATRTWGIWTCALPDCASPQRLTDPTDYSLEGDGTHLYFIEDNGSVSTVRVARCALADPVSCSAPEVLAPAWRSSGAFSDALPVGGQLYLRLSSALSRCASTSDCTTTSPVVSGGTYGDVVGDGTKLFTAVHTTASGMGEQLVGGCTATDCQATLGLLAVDEPPNFVTSLAIRGSTLYFVDMTYSTGETRPTRLFSCDVSSGLASCATSAVVMGSWDTGRSVYDNAPFLLVDAANVYVLSLLVNRVSGDNVVRIYRCAPGGCGTSGPELLATQHTPGDVSGFAMTSTHLYWDASPPTEADERIYRIAR